MLVVYISSSTGSTPINVVLYLLQKRLVDTFNITHGWNLLRLQGQCSEKVRYDPDFHLVALIYTTPGFICSLRPPRSG
jgi:hypothetical protein